MTTWLSRGSRWLPLTLLLVLAGVLPASGLLPAPRAPVLVAGGSSNDAVSEVSGRLELWTARPGSMPQATTPRSIAQLLADELQPSRAPLPAGPVTWVPILYYHYIRINPNPRDRVGFGLSTPPAMFAMQMQYLADHGFHVISLHQAVLAIRNHSGLPSRPVVLTFDDGYADFFTTAIPILRSHAFTATDFVISGRMGRYSFMTPSQVLAADRMGFTVGAHTVDHVALAAQLPGRASWEIRASKSMLESLLGHPVLDFAYPYGSFNQYDEAQARADGFECAVSTLYGAYHSAGQLFYLSRERIGGGLTLASFANIVGGPLPTTAELHGAGFPTPPATSSSSKVSMAIGRSDMLDL